MNSITVHQLGCLLLRSLAVLLTLQALPSFMSLLSMGLVTGNEWTPVLLTALPIILIITMSIVLWVVAPWLVRKMVTETTGTAAPFSVENLQIILLVVLGFVFLAEAIRPITSAVSHVISVIMGEKALQGTAIVEAILYLSLALWLIFTPHGITRMIKYARIVGGEK